jgi:hypothetical protein
MATAHDTGRSAADNIAFPAATPEPRYTVVTKCAGARRHTQSRHADLREAGEALCALVRGDVPSPKEMEWVTIYDAERGAASNARTRALCRVVFEGASPN